MKKKVSVPPAGGLGDKPCPICQDKLKSEWSDEEEEWVWWNAVNVEGTVSFFFLQARFHLQVFPFLAHSLIWIAFIALPRNMSR